MRTRGNVNKIILKAAILHKDSKYIKQQKSMIYNGISIKQPEYPQHYI